MAKTDGGPAFPLQTTVASGIGGTIDLDRRYRLQHGMTLRDYFAAHCPSDLAHVGINYDAEELAGKKPPADAFREYFEWNNRVEAALRYAYADAMLAERNK